MTRMNKWTPTTDLLTLRRMGKLLEELGEASNVAARVIIQGIDEVDPGSGKVNRERLENELADVQAQIGCTVLAFYLNQGRMARRTAEKMRQMAEWEALFAPDGVAPSDDAKALSDAVNEIDRLNRLLEAIGDYAHDHSTGPAVPDALWEVRRMAYEGETTDGVRGGE